MSQRLERRRNIDQRAATIVAAVRLRGDAALEAYAQRLDGLDGAIELTDREIRDGAARTPRDVRRAIAAAAAAIRKVASRQIPRPQSVTTRPGVTIELRPVPFDRAGCYVPGGRFPLISTMLMTAIPASEAGVREIVAVSPRPAPAHARGGARGGRRAVLPDRRRAGNRRARVRHAARAARGQDRRPRQCVGGRCEAPRRARLRHRLRGRPDGAHRHQPNRQR